MTLIETNFQELDINKFGLATGLTIEEKKSLLLKCFVLFLLHLTLTFFSDNVHQLCSYVSHLFM